MSMHTPHQFKSKPARLSMAVAGFLLGAAFGLRATDTGSVWQYGVFILASAISIRLIVLALKTK